MSLSVAAEESTEFDKIAAESDYRLSCAVCHGRSGSGDGPFGKLLRIPPADLTRLSSDNGGIFPFGEILEIIDGRRMIPSHGIREMPIWGWQFRQEAMDSKALLPAERQVSNRISNLAHYIATLQSN